MTPYYLISVWPKLTGLYPQNINSLLCLS